MGLTGCERKSSTPDWEKYGKRAEPQPADIPVKLVTKTKAKSAPAGDEATGPGLRFITYNVENWLTMDRNSHHPAVKEVPKPDSEKQAVIQLLTRHSPDVIGLCEIGTPGDLAEIQSLLQQAGQAFPHSHYIGGADPVRHLGLLSRFPIIATAVPGKVDYTLAGQTFAMNRGILDATVAAHGKSYRFLGVHLKSKRDSQQGDQEAIRLNEARLLRRHVDSIVAAEPDARLVVYGDFNDARSSPTLKMVSGNSRQPGHLVAIPVKDSQGDSWTHFWALNDIYSRFDYVMTSRALAGEVDVAASKILDDAEWNDASDHRPVLAIFK